MSGASSSHAPLQSLIPQTAVVSDLLAFLLAQLSPQPRELRVGDQFLTRLSEGRVKAHQIELLGRRPLYKLHGRLRGGCEGVDASLSGE